MGPTKMRTTAKLRNARLYRISRSRRPWSHRFGHTKWWRLIAVPLAHHCNILGYCFSCLSSLARGLQRLFNASFASLACPMVAPTPAQNGTSMRLWNVYTDTHWIDSKAAEHILDGANTRNDFYRSNILDVWVAVVAFKLYVSTAMTL